MNIYKRIFLFGLMAAATSGLSEAQGLYGYFGPHPWVGAWFGFAQELCATGDTTCPQASLFMTPSIFADGNFIGNDDFAIGGPPFGPHTTAHGQWVATGPDSITVDYVFMLPGTTATNVTALRFRWLATVTSPTTMQGYVNIFFGPEMPLSWTALSANQFPTIPTQQQFFLTPPTTFYNNPANCSGGPAANCPLIFKFSIARVAPPL
jgi:hypothetical protein